MVPSDKAEKLYEPHRKIENQYGNSLGQILLLSLYAGYQILDELQICSSMSAPFCCSFFRVSDGKDITTGLLIGGSMQLTVLGGGTFGGASRIDANSGTVLATAFSVALGMDPEQAIAAIAVPVASLMIQLDILARFANTYFAHRDRYPRGKYEFQSHRTKLLLGAAPWALITTLFLYFSRWLSVAD